MISEVFHQLMVIDPIFVALGIFGVLIACGFGLPLPEDITLAFTGYAVYRGIMPLWLGITIGLSGVLMGDSALWWIGHRWGEDVTKFRIFKRLLTPSRLKKVKKLYARYRNRILFAARFMPGLRAPIFLVGGWSGVKYRTFLLTDGLAALLSVPAIITTTWYFGDKIDHAVQAVKNAERWVLLAIVILIIYYIIRGRYRRRKAAAEALQNGNSETATTPNDSDETSRIEENTGV